MISDDMIIYMCGGAGTSHAQVYRQPQQINQNMTAIRIDAFSEAIGRAVTRNPVENLWTLPCHLISSPLSVSRHNVSDVYMREIFDLFIDTCRQYQHFIRWNVFWLILGLFESLFSVKNITRILNILQTISLFEMTAFWSSSP